ncbi:MAG: hypothetical protein IKN12_08995 [Selenomonadaceae bacterium]|nr:hypothetical protein [Selenomonadaceae bacterium]
MQTQYRLRTEHSLRVLLCSGGRQAGVIEGDYPPYEKGAFVIENLYFRDEFLDTEIISDAMRSLFDEITADRILWGYTEPEGCNYQMAREDPRYRLMKIAVKSCPGWELSWQPYGWDGVLDFTVLDTYAEGSLWHDNSYYSEDGIDKAGMKFLPITAMEDYAEQIRALCKSDPDADFMNPLYFTGADEEMSFLLVWNGEVVGWMILQRASSEEAHIPIFYSSKKIRLKGGGVRIAAHMVRSARKICRRVTFCLKPQSAGNRRFYERQLKEALTVSRHLRIEVRREN